MDDSNLKVFHKTQRAEKLDRKMLLIESLQKGPQTMAASPDFASADPISQVAQAPLQ
jgi:hypothetical protein